MKLEQLDLGSVLEQVGREKNIDKEVLVSALEEAMLSAARKKLGIEADLEARYNDEAGEVEVYEFLRIIKDGEVKRPGEIEFKDAKKLDPDLSEEAVGEDLGVKLESREFGRIAAQNAKQIIVQRVREAERLMVYNEYKDRKGEIVTGTVRRFERGDVIVDLGRAEAILPTSESLDLTDILVLKPASRAALSIVTIPSAISGTSCSKSLTTKLGWVLDKIICAPRATSKTSTT